VVSKRSSYEVWVVQERQAIACNSLLLVNQGAATTMIFFLPLQTQQA
jgi:hypothetical protein